MIIFFSLFFLGRGGAFTSYGIDSDSSLKAVMGQDCRRLISIGCLMDHQFTSLSDNSFSPFRDQIWGHIIVFVNMLFYPQTPVIFRLFNYGTTTKIGLHGHYSHKAKTRQPRDNILNVIMDFFFSFLIHLTPISFPQRNVE